MGFDGWFTVAVLAVMLVLLGLDRLPPSLVVLGATVTFMITGIITRDEAFAGFANPAPITVAALYVLAFAVQKTGLLSPGVSKLLGDGQARGRWAGSPCLWREPRHSSTTPHW